MASVPQLSIVIPMFNEADGLNVLFSRVVPILENITKDYEILCVNDGSRDATLAELKSWHKQNKRIKILSLSRNFGKEAALTAGLHHAYGEAVIPMDADL
jgi:glycosyltransferase involved in cell wall biosynthesis